MRKSGGRGRGRGRSLSAGNEGSGSGGASGGRGKKNIAPKSGAVEPGSSSGYTRPRTLPFLGVGKPLLKPEQQEQVLAYLADSASSSFASSRETGKSKSSASLVDVHGQGQVTSLSSSAKTTTEKNAAGDTTGYSMELFTHTVPGLESEAVNSPCPLQVESDMECTDAQPQPDYYAVPLTQTTTLPSQGADQESDPDETMLPHHERYTTDRHGDTNEVAHELQEEVIDDPVLDPDWQPLGEQGAGGSSSEAEEEEGPQQASTSPHVPSAGPVSCTKRVAKPKPGGGQRGHQVKAQSAMPEKVSDARKSAVWHFFKQHPIDQHKVICQKCSTTLSRGQNLKSLNTSCMHRHLTTMHLQAWTNYQMSLKVLAPSANETSHQRNIPSGSVGPPVSAPPAVSVQVSLTGQSSQGQGISSFVVGNTASRAPAPTIPSPTVSQSAMSTGTPASSTISSSPVQLTLHETMVRKRKYLASHPRTQGLNAHIARLISLEMMPYRLVESEAFKDLMDYAVPRYELPSRHFFSRKAIPALHQHVKERIVHALRQSVSTKVHLTTDAWTSRHGQGRYVSITAHWVNVVDSGSTGDSKFGTVLPSPRSSKQLAVAVRTPSSSSSSSSCRSKSSSTDRSRTNTPSAPATVAHQVSHYGAATGKRQQAVLAMKCLGDNRHTAEVLSEFLQQETQSWLGTVDLEAGKVVSDNGRNFMAAISLSQLKHIPCLAHTLNLVVQCFLKSYPGLSDLLLKVRGLCAHIRRSPVHSSRMQTYQRSLNLPQHRLIIDVATRWNSTLHMLQRLCEQRRAVMFLWEDTHTRAGSRMADMELSGVQWSKIQDMCQVLQCFEECTRLVSADNAIISMSIPLMCLLMQSLTHIKDQASAPEEEESLDDSQPLSGQGSVQDEVAGEEEVEDEEDDGDEYIFNEEAFPGSLEIGGVARPGSGFLRDTSDVDLPATAPQPSTTADLTTGTLGHMADYALRILKRDTRITKMMNDDDYWLACLLDPRYKGKLQNIMPHENLELILATKQSTLVDRLLLAFPAHSARDRSHTSSRGQQTRGVRGAEIRSGVGQRGFLTRLWSDFAMTADRTGTAASIQSDRRQHLSSMVTNYFSSLIDVLPQPSFPFDYWASKLDTWPELAEYALQELACPAASVLSERVFSAAGSILTEKRTRLATQNVDDLTFIKMNHKWISKSFAPPCPADT